MRAAEPQNSLSVKTAPLLINNEVSDFHARTFTRHAFLFAAFLRFFIAPARRKCAATAIQLRRFGVLVFFFFIPII